MPMNTPLGACLRGPRRGIPRHLMTIRRNAPWTVCRWPNARREKRPRQKAELEVLLKKTEAQMWIEPIANRPQDALRSGSARQGYDSPTADQDDRGQDSHHVGLDISPFRVMPIDHALADLKADPEAQDSERSRPFLYPVRAQQERKQSRKPEDDHVKSRMQRLSAGYASQP